MKSSGMKTATRERLMEMTVKPIWRAPSMAAGIELVHAVFAQTGDVLDHDDGVVDDEADGDRDGHERVIVEREAHGPHADERCRRCESGTVTAAAKVAATRRRKMTTVSSTSAPVMSRVICTSFGAGANGAACGRQAP